MAAPLPDTLVSRVLAEVRAPSGFDVTVFAAPPHVNYPTCLEAATTREVYACVDRT